MTLISQIPEQPINEDWEWLTDVLVSSNGVEQRICNSELAKRAFNVTYQFADAPELRTHLSAMFVGAKGAIQVPLYQYGTKVQSNNAIAEDTIDLNARRTELRVGDAALIYDRTGFELKTVESLTSSSVTFTTGLARAFSKKSFVCPVSTVYASDNSALEHGYVFSDAKGSLGLRETGFLDPFLNAYNAATLETLNDLPILTVRPIGKGFSEGFDTSISATDDGGVVDIRSPWTHAQLTFARSYLVNRVFDPDSWEMWRKFADTVKGSWKAFYMPSFKEDFELVTPPAVSGTSLTFGGTSYATEWFIYNPFKAVAIFTDAGVHYATVTAANTVGGNSVVTFSPALPASAGWENVLSVSLLYKVRIANDKIQLEHYPLHTQVSLALRTADE